MAKCAVCGKKGFFLKLNSNGLCQDCVMSLRNSAPKDLDKINHAILERYHPINKDITLNNCKEILRIISNFEKQYIFTGIVSSENISDAKALISENIEELQELPNSDYLSFYLLKNDINPTKLAEALFSGVNVVLGGTGKYAKIASILADSCSREEILLLIIHLCGVPTTSRQLYLIAYSYVWLGAKYRAQAIEFLNQYISSGMKYPKYSEDEGHWYANSSSLADIHCSEVYNYLGKAYEGEYMFDEAYKAYENCNECDPYAPSGICGMARICIKKNDLDSGIKLLESAQKNEFYKMSMTKGDNIDHSYYIVIDEKLKDLFEKKQRNYIYRPHKKK